MVFQTAAICSYYRKSFSILKMTDFVTHKHGTRKNLDFVTHKHWTRKNLDFTVTGVLSQLSLVVV